MTPRLLGRSMSRAAQWRLWVVSLLALAIPTILALIPYAQVFGSLLDQHPESTQWTAGLDSLALTDLLKQLNSQEFGAVVRVGPASASLALLFLAPFVAGLALAAAKSDTTLEWRELITDSAATYGRLFRFGLLALATLALFTLPGGLFLGIAENVATKAVTQAAATNASRWAIAGLALCLVIGQTIADCGRAQFAAEPHRRSAIFALVAGFRLCLGRPLRTLSVGIATWLLALLCAVILLRVRLTIPQAGVGGMFVAFALAQLSIVALVWGRTTRLIALVELARIERLARNVEPVVSATPPHDTRLPPEPQQTVVAELREPATEHEPDASGPTDREHG